MVYSIIVGNSLRNPWTTRHRSSCLIAFITILLSFCQESNLMNHASWFSISCSEIKLVSFRIRTKTFYLISSDHITFCHMVWGYLSGRGFSFSFFFLNVLECSFLSGHPILQPRNMMNVRDCHLSVTGAVQIFLQLFNVTVGLLAFFILSFHQFQQDFLSFLMSLWCPHSLHLMLMAFLMFHGTVHVLETFLHSI